MAKHRKPEDMPPQPASGKANKHFKFKLGKHAKLNKRPKWPKKDPEKK